MLRNGYRQISMGRAFCILGTTTEKVLPGVPVNLVSHKGGAESKSLLILIVKQIHMEQLISEVFGPLDLGG